MEAGILRWQDSLVALGCFVLICGLALGVAVAGGAVGHMVESSPQVGPFAALQHQWVAGAVLGIGMRWLLPPSPWSTRVVAASTTDGSETTRADAGAHEQHGTVQAGDGPSGEVPGQMPKGGTPTART